jgi:magnesium chelatase subunit D
MTDLPPGEAAWEDALTALSLLSIDPSLVGGAVLRARPGPVRDAWLAVLSDLLGADRPCRRIPVNVSESRLVGGLDLAATLGAGEPVVQTGLLAECDGGVAVLAMAERAARSTIAQLARALDTGEILLEREGLTARHGARLAVVALDEGAGEDELVAPALNDRLAFHLDLDTVAIRDLSDAATTRQQLLAARARLPAVTCGADALSALCVAALALGVESPRMSRLAAATARLSAAMAGRETVESPDLELAIRLVLAPRATRLPVEPDEAQTQQSQDAPADPPQAGENDGRGDDRQERLEDQLIEAAAAAIPPDLLATLLAGERVRTASSGGKSGEANRSRLRGRPMGTSQGDPRRGNRLSPTATLRAAAPWQPLRRAEAAREGRPATGMQIERDDFRVVRFRDRSESTTVFVVDASGSAALNRLAEAKGAIELLLADCYIRRDQVALIAFRGDTAELLLPPTRSLVRAKRNLAALPGGGGTPLGSAVEMAGALGEAIRRRGGTPALVFLTDGRANIARDGSRGREVAAEDLSAAAAQFRSLGLRSMVIDTSPRPHPAAESLSRELSAVYLPLPHADATALRDAVQSASA